MLIEVNEKTYRNHFYENPHPYISEPFINLNKGRVDKVVRLIEKNEKVDIGMVAGIKDGILKSPFSAPFGGFHFRHNNLYVSVIESFICQLKAYVTDNRLKKVEIGLPPDIYHLSFNTKVISTLLRNDFSMPTPEITNWVDLNEFPGVFSNRGVRKYLKQATNHGLSFHEISEKNEKEEAYNLIRHNREQFGRPIYMTFYDLENTSKLWPVDFFRVNSKEGSMVASAVFYRGHSNIAQGIFWGDNEEGRPLRAIDFCAFNLWNHYKNLRYIALDLGISTESSIPNEGLLRFKETHECTSSLRYTFAWSPV